MSNVRASLDWSPSPTGHQPQEAISGQNATVSSNSAIMTLSSSCRNVDRPMPSSERNHIVH